ncbi:efflux pump antibiotic resistance protein [Talaromyces proteolyticus]|uniref:Efflux pump antibiotic resistance protein n=1 Tax=Talaromyces proteolyticus TaxID=1131652 RepID=A0AAD4KFN3_9EURO|nr:efflux pump antibiotic resistance protein [Talaromyces proteolyticus]KAH8690581.1 efflux pump antibiotic resistance protein [Talaromyces proteolyticus]
MGVNEPGERSQLTSENASDSRTYRTIDKPADTPESDLLSPTESEFLNAGAGERNHDDSNKQPKQSSIWGVVWILLLGEFVSHADGTITFASAGRISSEFNALPDANWLATAYSLGVCAAMPMYGKLSDIYGRKNILLLAYSFFGIGSVLCGIGVQMWHVVLGRAVMGLGGAGMATLAAIIITDIVPRRDIATWRAYVNIASTLGRAAGGPIGGALTDLVGWRWLFTGQAIFIAMAALLTILKLNISREPHLDNQEEPASSKSKLARIDFIGTFFLSASVVSGITLLDIGGKKFSWTSPYTISLGVASLVLLIAFVLTEAFWAREPIFSLRILRQPNVIASYLVMTFQVLAQVGMMYTIPLYFQVTGRASTSSAGAHLVPAVVGNAVAGIVAGVFIKRTGRYRGLTIVAGLIAAVTYILEYFRWNGNTNWWESLYIIPGGIGTSIAQAASFVSMTSRLEQSDIAMATSGIFLLSQVGVSASITANNAALESEFKNQLQRKITGEGAEHIIERILSDVSYINQLTGNLREIVVSSYVQGLKYTYVFSLISSTLASISGLMIRNHQL